MISLRSILRSASTRLGRPTFVLLVAFATLTAPGTSLALGWYRAALEESNEQRTEIDGSDHARGALLTLRRGLKNRNIPAKDAAIITIQFDILDAHRRSIAERLRRVPSADSWLAPLRF